MKLLTLASCSLLSLPLVACTSSSMTDVTADEYDDVAQNVGTSTASQSGGDVTAMSDVVVVADGALPLGWVLGADGTISGTFLGITYSFSLTCTDSSGTAVPGCGSTTDNADAKLDWSGQLSLPNFSTTMDRHGEWSVSNLQSSTVDFGGTGSFTFDSMITNPNTKTTAAYHFDYDASYAAVAIDKASKVAVSGELDYQIDASKTVDGQPVRTFSLDATVTFNGDGTATIALDGTHHYSLDLSTSVVVKID